MLNVVHTKVYDVNSCINLLFGGNSKLLNTNIKELKKNSKQKFSSRNIFDVQDYIYDYDSNLKDIERTYTKGNPIKLHLLEIPLRKNKTYEGELRELTNKIIDFISEESYIIPYISFVKGKSLFVIIFDRYFYPYGKKVEIKAKSDYKDGSYKKGDTIKIKKMYVSHKIPILRFSSKETMKNYFKAFRYILTSTKRKFKIIKMKKLKKVNKYSYTQVKRKDNIYEKVNEWKYRKTRIFNSLLRLIEIDKLKVPKSEIECLKKLINTNYSVFLFEERINIIINDS